MTIDLSKPVEVQVYDPTTLSQISRIKAYEYFKYTRNYYTHDSFEFQCRRSISGASEIEIGTVLSYYDGAEVRAGIVEYLEYVQEGDRDDLMCRGRCVGGLFRNRIALEGTNVDTGLDTVVATPAETAMLHYVDRNLVSSSDTNRNVPGLTLTPDLGRGAAVTYSARFDAIHDILEDIGRYAGVGWDVTFDRTAREFNFAVRVGVDRRATVKFSRVFRNTERLEYIHNQMGSPSVAIVAGDGTGASRNVVISTLAGASANRFSWREAFVDAGDISESAELMFRGVSKLGEFGDGISVEVQVTNNTFKYLDDYDLGDIITVVYPGVFTLESRIVSIMDEIATDGRRLHLTVGTEPADIVSLVRDARKPTRGELV